jgi:phosphatidylethanolamine-binding protein (PEBP) family uncharacterized protein
VRFGILIIITSLMISACGGTQTDLPTLVNEANTPAETAVIADAATPEPDTSPQPIPTIRPTFEGELVPGDPQTLVASRTEDPDANVPFSTIRVERTGGPFTGETPEPLVVEISGDGKITRNGTEGRVEQATLDTLNALIREMNFFGASGDYLGVVPLDGTENYFYTITVVRGDLTRSIQAQDGSMPQELTNIIARVLQEGSRF